MHFALHSKATRTNLRAYAVAIKRISVDMMDMKTRDKCLKEVRVLQNLDHPNIIRYLESFIHGNDLFIVFEWAAAGDLKRQLRKAQEKNTQFSERIVWKYFAQICEAMQHMHERRIMHRDLKVTIGCVNVARIGLDGLKLWVHAASEHFLNHRRHHQSR